MITAERYEEIRRELNRIDLGSLFGEAPFRAIARELFNELTDRTNQPLIEWVYDTQLTNDGTIHIGPHEESIKNLALPRELGIGVAIPQPNDNHFISFSKDPHTTYHFVVNVSLRIVPTE